MLLVYGGLLYLTVWSFGKMPTGFIPDQDQGYLFAAIQLPDSASLERTEEVVATRPDNRPRHQGRRPCHQRLAACRSCWAPTARTWARCSSFSTRSTSGSRPT